MLNFQNIMKQTENLSGALWCDEGVYHIAREIQLLSHYSFDNIFFGTRWISHGETCDGLPRKIFKRQWDCAV